MHLPLLMDLLTDGMQNSGTIAQKSIRYYLLALLSRMEQAIETGNARILSSVPETSQAPGVPLHHSSPQSAQALLVQRACRFVEANLTKPLTVQSIADQLYISPSHLNRLFRNELEMAPMKYVAQHRMEVARSLLEETNYSIFDISETIGYSHPDVFRRAFTNHFGLGPVAFRSRHRHKLRSSSTLRKSD
jgi:transcriptional regulator GlxA family with amidase domain